MTSTDPKQTLCIEKTGLEYEISQESAYEAKNANTHRDEEEEKSESFCFSYYKSSSLTPLAFTHSHLTFKMDN